MSTTISKPPKGSGDVQNAWQLVAPEVTCFVRYAIYTTGWASAAMLGAYLSFHHCGSNKFAFCGGVIGAFGGFLKAAYSGSSMVHSVAAIYGRLISTPVPKPKPILSIDFDLAFKGIPSFWKRPTPPPMPQHR